MRYIAMSVAAAILFSGCVSTGTTRTIESTPPGASVTIKGFGECETPCTVKLDGRRSVTVAKAGYKAQRFDILPGAEPVVVILELAAASEEVDSVELPRLD